MSGYISEMRKLVGQRTIIQCAASIICVDPEGRVLLGRRTDNHLWGYAGGSVEIDEKIEDCARRELWEEMGLTAEELELFDINSGPEVHYVYPNGDEVSNVEIIYLCRRYHGELRRQEEEMEELRFFRREEIRLEEISPPIRPVLRKLLETESVFAPVRGIHHISMKCDTAEALEKAKDFYLNLLGCTVVREWPEGIMIDTGRGMLEIFSNGPGIPQKGALRHIAFAAEDVDAVAEKVRQAGYTVFIDPKDIVVNSRPEFHARMAFCYGPLGEEIEFFREQ